MSLHLMSKFLALCSKHLLYFCLNAEMSFLGYHRPPYLHGSIGAVEGNCCQTARVIPDSLPWPSLDHPQANHDGVFARIVHLVDHNEDQLCCA